MAPEALGGNIRLSVLISRFIATPAVQPVDTGQKNLTRPYQMAKQRVKLQGMAQRRQTLFMSSHQKGGEPGGLVESLGLPPATPRVLIQAVAESLASRFAKPATIFSLKFRRSAGGKWRSLQELKAYQRLVRPTARPASSGPMRLSYVLHNSLPYVSGGYATRARGVVRGLAANGIDLAVVTRTGFPQDQGKHTGPVPETDLLDGIFYHRLSGAGINRILLRDYVHQAAAAMQTFFKAQHTTHVMAATSAFTCGLPALIAARRLGLPFFYEVRGFWEITRASREPAFDRSFNFRFRAALEQLVCNEADHVFTLTQPMKDELVARGLAAEKVTLVPNSCDIERFTPRPRDEELAAELGIPPGLPVIGYIGTFVDYEGLDDLAEAAGLLRQRGQDFRLLLVGGENVTDSSQGPLTRRIREIVAAEGLDTQVIMPGRVPHDMVERYYSLIDIAPFPRKPWRVCEMVSPMKPLEAMAMEKTVLVSSVQALKEMVRHGETGWVFDKGSVESLAEELGALLADPELRRKLGRQSRQWVAAERTWKHTTKVMADHVRASAPAASLAFPAET